MTGIRTTCAYCGVGCGVIARPHADGSVGITGDPQHPANFGRLCSKGAALGETLGLGHRLLHPLVHGSRASWSDAVAVVAETFTSAIRDHGPDSVAFYVSGQLLTEDYYAANKLMKGFIGSANIDTNSRLCMASAVAGHLRAFGADVVPCNYTDLEQADLVILVGSNLAWCHPVLSQRLMEAKQKRGSTLVVIDPRRTVTAEAADLHLPLKPGSDVALFNGLLADLYRRGATDSRFIFKHTSGLAEAMLAARQWTLARVAEATGLAEVPLRTFYDLFARTPRTVTAFSMGVNQSSAGTDKVNAIINCHLVTGRIGKPGCGPFSLTGQPNAMGGREVGGLATTLAAHMQFDNADHRNIVQDHWKSPRLAEKPGLKAVDLFRAVGEGRIKALWIMATNPAVSMPDSTAIAEALKACPFVAISDVTAATDTARQAHVFLPAAGWGEKDGTVTNSERRISRQRAFLPLPGEARPDWRIICDVAKAMGFSGFDYESPAEIFREHAALTAAGNQGLRLLDLGALTGAGYDSMAPVQWGSPQPFASGQFSTPDGRARFIATPVKASPSHTGAMTLNTGRIRDQWHTMTRTGLVPRLFTETAEPFIEINPWDAEVLGIAPAEIVEVRNGPEPTLLRAMITSRVRRGEVFAPMHWSDTNSAAARVNRATDGSCDPISGQPELKLAAVRVGRFSASWFGFGVTVSSPNCGSPYWSIRPVMKGFAVECAGVGGRPDSEGAFRDLMGLTVEEADIAMAADRSSGSFRFVAMSKGRVLAALFVGAGPVAVSRSWAASLLAQGHHTPSEVLAGLPRDACADPGPIVCICGSVGRNTIVSAAKRFSGLNAVCQFTGAGILCGSCRPQVARIVDERTEHVQAAE